MPLNILLITILLALTACGFSPVYDSGGIRANTELSQVIVKPLPERSGQILRNNLLDRGFGHAQGRGSYTLNVLNFNITEIDLGIAPDDTSTRRQLTASGILRLRDSNNTIMIDRRIVARTSYNVLISQFGTNVSRDSALENALNDMARQIETHSLLAIKTNQ